MHGHIPFSHAFYNMFNISGELSLFFNQGKLFNNVA